MGNASASMQQRERHKSSDISTPNSPFRDTPGRDSVAAPSSASGVYGAHHIVGSGGSAAGVSAAYKTADATISHGSSQDDEEQPYYTKPAASKGDAGTGTVTPTNTSTATTTLTATADNNSHTSTAATITTTTTAAAAAAAAPNDPEFGEAAAEPRKRSNTVSEGTALSTMSAAKEESTKDEQASTSAAAAAAAASSSAIGSGALPTVLRWDGGGKNVMISGTFTKWKPIPMVRSHGNFVTIVDLPEGDHQYKFYVDGEWRHDPKLKSVDTEHGDKNNLVSVRQSDFEVFQALAKDSENTPNYAEREYSQEVPQSKPWEKVSGPPVLPPHLLQVILNKDTPLSCEPTLLPEPNHVMLNHLYALSIKDGVMVLSATHRYRKKYVTTLLYKPI